MSDKLIYLDSAATTAVDKSIAEIALKYYTDDFYNPSSLYKQAHVVKRQLEDAAARIGRLLGADGGDIVFTSCATESNNYALECGYKNKKGNLVISGGEHASVYEKAMNIKSGGRDVRIVPLKPDGRVDGEKLLAAVDENTALVSVIHVSNETGAINDAADLCKRVKDKNKRAVFHSDGVQAFCKLNIDLQSTGIDLYSVSAHKVGGLKGVGALYVKKGFNMKPFIVGGGQQGNRRSGTENVGGIVSFAAAAELYKSKAACFNAKAVYNYLVTQIKSELDYAIINGSADSGNCYILSVSFPGIKGEVLAHMLEEKGILIGLGSACSTHVKQSRVHLQLGLSQKETEGSIRISLSPDNTVDEIKYAASELMAAVKKLKGIIDG